MERNNIQSYDDLITYFGEQLINGGFKKENVNYVLGGDGFFDDKYNISISYIPVVQPFYSISLGKREISKYSIMSASNISRISFEKEYVFNRNVIDIVDGYIDYIFNKTEVKIELRKIKLKKLQKNLVEWKSLYHN